VDQQSKQGTQTWIYHTLGHVDRIFEYSAINWLLLQ